MMKTLFILIASQFIFSIMIIYNQNVIRKIVNKLSDDADDLKRQLGLKTASDIKADWIRFEEAEAIHFAKMLTEGKTLEEVESLIEGSYKNSFKNFIMPYSKNKLIDFVREIAERSKS